jgi:hypothetical protein
MHKCLTQFDIAGFSIALMLVTLDLRLRPDDTWYHLAASLGRPGRRQLDT